MANIILHHIRKSAVANISVLADWIRNGHITKNLSSPPLFATTLTSHCTKCFILKSLYKYVAKEALQKNFNVWLAMLHNFKAVYR